MKNIIRLVNSIISIIIVATVILANSIEVNATNKCAYYSKYTGNCPYDAISGSKYCKAHTCMGSGCYKMVNSGNSRCDSCKKEYYDQLGITTTTCNDSWCSKNKASGSSYCSTHTCGKTSCNSKIVSGSKFCAAHTCQKGRFGCYNEVNSGNEKCSSCKKGNNSSSSTSNSSKNNSSKKQTTASSSKKKNSSKKTSMPDCDDYDSYDEFMDEWDGCMPDGSDAEDYWENW